MSETGLYLGKFAPLHRGHQYVIEEALSRVDNLIVLIYARPELVDIPVTVRKEWIEDLCPEVSVEVAWTGPIEHSEDNDDMQERHRTYIDERFPDTDFSHFFSSESYGAHMSEFLDAKDCRIDPERKKVPVSSTEIREDLYNNRGYVSDRVYKDMIVKSCFVGVPLCVKGKTARCVAEYYNGLLVSEESSNISSVDNQNFVELLDIHKEKEQREILDAEKYLFSNMNAVSAYVSMKIHEKDIPGSIEERAIKSKNEYDYMFLVDCSDRDVDAKIWNQTELNNFKRVYRMTKDFLEKYQIPYYKLTGSLEERRDEAVRVIENKDRYNSCINH